MAGPGPHAYPFYLHFLCAHTSASTAHQRSQKAGHPRTISHHSTPPHKGKARSRSTSKHGKTRTAHAGCPHTCCTASASCWAASSSTAASSCRCRSSASCCCARRRATCSRSTASSALAPPPSLAPAQAAADAAAAPLAVSGGCVPWAASEGAASAGESGGAHAAAAGCSGLPSTAPLLPPSATLAQAIGPNRVAAAADVVCMSAHAAVGGSSPRPPLLGVEEAQWPSGDAGLAPMRAAGAALAAKLCC
jgi:hypothetical protein